MKLKQKYFPFTVTLLSLVAGYLVANPLLLHLCRRIYSFNDDIGCLDKTIATIGTPLFTYALVTIPASLALIFVKKDVFNAWLRFAAWWLPLSVVLIATTSENSNSWMPIYFISKDLVTQVMASLFTIISLILIAWKTFATRSKKT
jgi:hypothetical protein